MSLYRISLSLHDAPGVLHSALESIARHGGNVLNLDSASSDQETLHNIELLVDFASLLDTDSLREGLDLTKEIEGILLADCSGHVVEEPKGNFNIRARPMMSLRRLHQMIGKLRGSVGQDIQEARIDKEGEFQLERPFRRLLGTLFSGSSEGKGVVEPLAAPIQYFVTSDTHDRVFRISLVRNPDSIVWCAIRHQDRPGALSTATDALQKCGITVLTALNRIQRHQGINWFEVIVSKPQWVREPSDLHERQAELEDVFGKTHLGKFGYQLFFDRTPADEAMRSINEEPETHVWVNEREPVDSWLKDKEESFGRLQAIIKSEENAAIPTSRDSTSLFNLRRQLNALRQGISMVRMAKHRLSPVLFLSIEFTEQNYLRIDIAEEYCRAHGIRLDTVKATADMPVVKEEVLRRIGEAAYFVAVWTPTEKESAGNARPSPWCLWELGVAAALRKPFAVVIQKGMSDIDYRSIYSESFYFQFSGATEFRSKFEIACQMAIRGALR